MYGGLVGGAVLAAAIALGLLAPDFFSGAGLASPETAFGYGHEFELRGQYADAEVYYRRALARGFPREARAWQCRLHLANVLYRQGRYTEAVAEYASVPEAAYAHSLESLRSRARALMCAKDFVETGPAAAAWEQFALERGLPEEAHKARLLRGDALVLAGRPADALRKYAAAGDSAPGPEDERNARLRMAVAEYARGDRAAAERLLGAIPAEDAVSREGIRFLREAVAAAASPATMLEHLPP